MKAKKSAIDLLIELLKSYRPPLKLSSTDIAYFNLGVNCLDKYAEKQQWKKVEKTIRNILKEHSENTKDLVIVTDEKEKAGTGDIEITGGQNKRDFE